LIRKALAEVARHTDLQRFKRENPEAVYKKVKSKIAGNMKSIAKANTLSARKRQAEIDPKASLVEEAKIALKKKLKAATNATKSPSPTTNNATKNSAIKDVKSSAISLSQARGGTSIKASAPSSKKTHMRKASPVEF